MWGRGGGRRSWLRFRVFFSVCRQETRNARPDERRRRKERSHQALSLACFFLGRTSLGDASSVMVAALTKESLALIVSALKDRCNLLGPLLSSP